MSLLLGARSRHRGAELVHDYTLDTGQPTAQQLLGDGNKQRHKCLAPSVLGDFLSSFLEIITFPDDLSSSPSFTSQIEH
jgi:hypothetical protein